VWPVPEQIVEVPAVGRGLDWVDWLADHPDAGSGDGSVAMIPFPPDGNYASYENTTVWMLSALDHHHPLVNGYSGLFPENYDNLEATMREGFPTEETVKQLADDHVSYVVATQGWLEADGQAALDSWTDVFQPVFRGREMTILAFTAPPG
jgi:hypothetical protein